MRGESVLIEIKLEGRLLFRALFYSKEAAARGEGEGFFFAPIFFLSSDSFLFLFKHNNNNKYNVVKQQQEQKSIQHIRPTIDRYEMTQPHPGLFFFLSASSLNFSTIGSR